MAPADDDISIDEKRVYAGNAGRNDVYVATETGLVRVAVSGDKVGTFELLGDRGVVRDVAVCTRPGRSPVIAAATEHGLYTGPVGDEPTRVDVDGDVPVAVGDTDGALSIADADGTLSRVTVDDDGTPTGTHRVGRLDDVTAIAGPFVAGRNGVHRVDDATGGTAERGAALVSVGLDDARDVAATGMPLAATATGLYWLGNGWMPAIEGDATAVAADGGGAALAVVDGHLLAHETGETDWSAAAWAGTALPVDERPVALAAHPGLAVVVTEAGTLCVEAGDGWRHQALGVPGVSGVAVAPGR
jgi:hypothetical protein